MQRDAHHKWPAEAFKPLVEFCRVSKQQEDGPQELQQGDGHKRRRCRSRKTQKRNEGKTLKKNPKHVVSDSISEELHVDELQLIKHLLSQICTFCITLKLPTSCRHTVGGAHLHSLRLLHQSHMHTQALKKT